MNEWRLVSCETEETFVGTAEECYNFLKNKDASEWEIEPNCFAPLEDDCLEAKDFIHYYEAGEW